MRYILLLIATLIVPLAAEVSSETSPAGRHIARLEKSVAAEPANPRIHTMLAMAYARKARETAEMEWYDKAGAAIDKALELRPADFEAEKARVWVLLGKHEFARALEQARALNKRAPDDLQVYGFLVDAHAELGNYKDAEAAAQWMLDLRPGNVPGLTRAAYLRELFGDLEGARQLMLEAFDRTPATESEDRAWLATHIGRVERHMGKLDDAEQSVKAALQFFPNYHYALAEMAHLESDRGRHAEAARLMEQRYRLAPHPENLYEVAEALARAGRVAEAKDAYERFAAAARKEMDGWDNANRELIAYYAGAGRDPKEALRLAEQEMARRQDVYTLAAYATALEANRRHDDARKALQRALEVGVRDPKLLAQMRQLARR